MNGHRKSGWVCFAGSRGTHLDGVLVKCICQDCRLGGLLSTCKSKAETVPIDVCELWASCRRQVSGLMWSLDHALGLRTFSGRVTCVSDQEALVVGICWADHHDGLWRHCHHFKCVLHEYGHLQQRQRLRLRRQPRNPSRAIRIAKATHAYGLEARMQAAPSMWKANPAVATSCCPAAPHHEFAVRHLAGRHVNVSERVHVFVYLSSDS